MTGEEVWEEDVAWAPIKEEAEDKNAINFLNRS